MRRWIAALALVLLAGCSSSATTDSPTTTAPSTDAAALVAERYGECLSALGVTEAPMLVGSDTVVARKAGANGRASLILKWIVAQRGGKTYTQPADTATDDALTSVDC